MSAPLATAEAFTGGGPAPMLGADQFGDFYRAVHGRDPFPWQTQITARVLEDGQWPGLVDVPTGLGKTSMLDIAVFVAAATAGTPAADRVGRRRIFFVVDRRLVVDEAYDHALRLADTLTAAEADGSTGVLADVARGLRTYAPHYPRLDSPDVGPGPLLPVTRMRGGTTWSAAWLDRPDRPGIVLGTVDQVGSRLLFRGYGVSDRRRPIDAALVGTDAVLLVDEAHLSTALLDTVEALRQRDTLGVPLPGLDVVRLSATGRATTRPFVLDVEAHRDDETAWRRLTAGKSLSLLTATSKDCAKTLAQTALGVLAQLSDAEPDDRPAQAPVALVVCNTVDRARAVHTLLTKLLAGKTAVDADCELLIGRARPIDRPTVQNVVRARYGTGRAASSRPAILVATQTVEVGVNLDVDVLVTESASWDALVQRLGRLNRLGLFDERFPSTPAAPVVVVHDGQADGPLYGLARDRTWDALTALVAEHGAVDVSPLACRALTADALVGPQFVFEAAGAPMLLRPTLDAWTQTAPVPLIDPPIEAFLHGFGRGQAAVQVLWRDGLRSDDALDDPFDDQGSEVPAARAHQLLTDVQPATPEIVEIPFVAVKQWMQGLAPDPIADLDLGDDTDGGGKKVRDPFRVLARRPAAARDERVRDDADSGERWCWITADRLRPGDVIVVPTESGGLDRYGWAPAVTQAVSDVADAATFTPGRGRRVGVLRLDRDRLAARLALTAEAAAEVVGLLDAITEIDDESQTSAKAREAAQRLADLLPSEPAAGWDDDRWAALSSWLGSSDLRLVEAARDQTQVVGGRRIEVWGGRLVGPLPDERAQTARGTKPPVSALTAERDDEGVVSSSIGSDRVTLAQHHAAVRERAAHIARALGLPDELRGVLEDAARFHDLGKCEERFQAMLHGGDPFEVIVATEPLAKSGMDPADRDVWRRAAKDSQLPRGARHEAWSAALVEAHLADLEGAYPGDSDLLVHLVASHHGYARPWAKLVTDRAPRDVVALVDGEKVTVDSANTVSLAQPARFARLNERYGRWGLALLESIVRCADITVSEEGS